MADWFVHIGDWDPTTTALGVAAIVLIPIGKRIPATERLAPVLVLAVMTIVLAILDPATVATVADMTSVPCPQLSPG